METALAYYETSDGLFFVRVVHRFRFKDRADFDSRMALITDLPPGYRVNEVTVTQPDLTDLQLCIARTTSFLVPPPVIEPDEPLYANRPDAPSSHP